MDAKRLAFDAGSFANVSPDRNGVMFFLPVFFARSSLELCHQSFELAFPNLSRIYKRNKAYAARKPSVHRSRAKAKSSDPMTACFNRNKNKHLSSIQRCLYAFSWIVLVAMNFMNIKKTKSGKSRASSTVCHQRKTAYLKASKVLHTEPNRNQNIRVR